MKIRGTSGIIINRHILSLAAFFVLSLTIPAYAQHDIETLHVEKPRIIILTDITNEPDDQQSLVRFLVYANEFDVEGLIATTSTHIEDEVRPDVIKKLTEAYGQVRGNLLEHARGYPTEAYLQERISAHLPVFGMEGVGEGKSSEGSRLIIDVVDEEDDRPVWVTVWGGANCLAQALWEVRNTRDPEEVAEFISKLRIYTISDQDDSGPWIRKTFPELFYIVSPSDPAGSLWYYRATWTGISGDRFYQNGPMYKFRLVDNPWLEENIMNEHGPLGELYPSVAYIMEGDTPSYLGLIRNGLGWALSPGYGGWGGRYQFTQPFYETRPIWTNSRNSRDKVVIGEGRTYVSDQATIWRWRGDYQHDFAARMDWCVMSYEEANHNPAVVVNGYEGKDVLVLTAPPGAKIILDAAGTSDPDGDSLSYRWWIYPEAGTTSRWWIYSGSGAFPGDARIEGEGANQPKAVVHIPSSYLQDDRRRPEGDTEIHVILEVTDNGTPSLTSYRRVIIKVSRLVD